MEADERLDMLIKAAQASPLTFDVLFSLSCGMDDNAVAILCGNVSKLPAYMKSKDIPYLSRSRMALSAGIQKSPLSH